ncbi:hypothetical protein CGCS363_v003585 [Colletotrichum siamense]|uniref:uncharacterized protein n=1 Tax=Colletotrichum siamense TaxID=690259 RepID=UPI0018723ACC|nr:uncharacterized protein CGCS363_v003585 [Colletotrichum siamense]KAF5510640.1 hypothetical protein CGCS363_v003585 [Colletotrichum siamense]
MSEFDLASDEDFDPGYVSEDSPSDASDSSTCIDMLTDLGEYEDEDDEAAGEADDQEDDEEDDLEPSHARCFAKRYEKVRVMSMIWDVSGLCSTKYPYTVDQEMEDPMESFEDYRYEVEKFTIPSTLPARRLQEKFRQCRKSLEYENSETLLIFWYNGHGDIVGDGRDLVLCGELTMIYWKDIVAGILRLPCDVLVVLDCCHAGAFVQDEKFLKPFLQQNRRYIKEVLCTAGFERTTKFGQRYSLAPVLSETLDAHRQRGGLGLDHLFSVLNYKLKNHYIRGKKRSNTLVLQRLISGRPGTLQIHPLPDPSSVLTKKRSASSTFASCGEEQPKRRKKVAKAPVRQKWICIQGRWEVAKKL